MRKIINSTYISLDGVVERPHLWPTIDRPSDGRGEQIQTGLLMACDAVLMGRRTYEGFAPVWQTRSGDAISDRMNAMPKYVVSTTLADADAKWENTKVIRGDVRGAVERLKRDISGDILIAGSAKLVQSLTEYGLVDQYRLMTFPIVLGTGKRLFEGGVSKTKLRLVDNTPVGNAGVVILTYEPA